MSSDCVAMIKAYLEGGERDGFGARNPFENFSGEWGTDGLAKALAVDVKTSECPDEDTRYSAMLFGKLVGASTIGAEDRMMVQMFMEVAYEDNVTSFNKGLSMVKAVARAASAADATGAHGGKVPTDAEAISIAAEKGMPWQQVVAVSSVLFSGTVPTLAEIGQEGYGSDPGQWSSAKEARKAGKACLNTFLKSRDAEGYRTMITKGANRLAASGPILSPAASHLMLFITKLSKMTFDQGMGNLFLDYCEEHIEVHKGKGLASAGNPLDTNVLTETVLAEKNKTRDNDSKMEKVIEQMDQLSKMENTVKSRLGEMSALASKVSMLERELAESRGNGGKPSATNSCSYCKSPDHFIRDCPKKKEADEKKARTAAEAGTSTSI